MPKDKKITIPERIQKTLQEIQKDINALTQRRNDILQTVAMALGVDGQFNIQPDFSAIIEAESPVQEVKPPAITGVIETEQVLQKVEAN